MVEQSPIGRRICTFEILREKAVSNITCYAGVWSDERQRQSHLPHTAGKFSLGKTESKCIEIMRNPFLGGAHRKSKVLDMWSSELQYLSVTTECEGKP